MTHRKGRGPTARIVDVAPTAPSTPTERREVSINWVEPKPPKKKRSKYGVRPSTKYGVLPDAGRGE